MLFFFKQKTAYEMRISDWSSDVCSSDLQPHARRHQPGAADAEDASGAAASHDRGAGSGEGPPGDPGDRRADHRPGLQHCPSHLSVKGFRGPFERLRVRSGGDARALAKRAGRHPPHARRSAARSEEHTSELQSLMRISYAVFCLKKKKQTRTITTT